MKTILTAITLAVLSGCGPTLQWQSDDEVTYGINFDEGEPVMWVCIDDGSTCLELPLKDVVDVLMVQLSNTEFPVEEPEEVDSVEVPIDE